MKVDDIARATRLIGDTRESTNGAFLDITLLRQGHRGRKQSLNATLRVLVSTLCLVIVLRLVVESVLVRKYLFSARFEQTARVQNEDSSLRGRNQTIVLPPSICDKMKDCSLKKNELESIGLGNISSPNDPITICSGSTFQSVPSAMNLISPSRTQEKQQHSCYETRHGEAFWDKSDEGHNFSDGNYVFHVLGGGRCNENGFESLPHNASKNIIVTAYYEIPSKHPPKNYHEWMGNFLSVYRDPIVIFTSPNLVELISNLRRHNVTESCDNPPCAPIFFDTIIVALPLEEVPLSKLYPKSFWVDQLDRDPQSRIHSPLRGDPRMEGKFESGELYWIWLSKIWFVVESTRILGVNRTLNVWTDSANKSIYNNKVFAWIDVGSFRNNDPIAKNASYPPLLIRHPEVVPASEMLFWSHSSAHFSQSSNTTQKSHSTKNYKPIPPRQSPFFDDKSLGGGKYFFHAGAHFAGRPISIYRFYNQFLQTIDSFVERNLTLADDQAVMQSSCLSFSFESCSEHGCEETPDNLCSYATRDMAGGKSKWFGLTKLLQTGWSEAIQRTRTDSGLSNPHDLYWKPPPPTYYLDYAKESIWSRPNCSTSRERDFRKLT